MANDATSSTALQAGKVTKLLRGLETYVSGQAEIIIDYATARRCGEPISTASTESMVQWLLHRRMSANQQMRWSPRGAHLMLKVRTAVMNGTFGTMPLPSGVPNGPTTAGPLDPPGSRRSLRSTSSDWFSRSSVTKASSLIAPLVSFNEARRKSRRLRLGGRGLVDPSLVWFSAIR